MNDFVLMGAVMAEWTKFAERRPEGEGLFWFRIAGFKFPGTEISVEWVDKVSLHGMGYGEDEYWPGFSNWNGYQRTVPAGVEWQPIKEGDKKDAARYPGISLTVCPHCGRSPNIEPTSRWITMPVFSAREFAIHCRCRGSFGPRYNGLGNAAAAWNRRTPLVSAAHDMLSVLKAFVESRQKGDWNGVFEAEQSAEAAIAKAEGRTP